MTLKQIFKDKPELLEEKEVIELIDYVKDQHKKNLEIFKTKIDFYDHVLEQVVYSELMTINGKPCKEVLESIIEKLH